MRLNTGRDSKRKINTECIIGGGAVLIHRYSGVIIPKNVTASRLYGTPKLSDGKE